MPLVLGGLGVIVVIVLLVFWSKGGGSGAGDDAGAAQAAGKPAPVEAASAPALKPASAKAGKPPETPAPPLTMATLEQVRALLQEAKGLRNEGVTLRNAGQNVESRAKHSQAKVKIDALTELIQPALDWQESAEIGGWAQPAEYTTLANLWTEIASVQKAVRMGGGTR